MQNTILRYGVLGGTVIVGLMLGGILLQGDSPNFKNGEIFGYASMLLALSTIFFGIRNYRDTQLGGAMSFGEAFRIGILIALVVSAFYVIGWLIISNTIAADFSEQYFNHYLQNLKESGLSEAEIEKQAAAARKSVELYENNLLYKVGITFLEIFPVDLVVTLVSALILKKKG